MNTAPVSVIIPCYNCAGTIGRALDSVLAQTRRPREIILVDDGSTDATRDRLAAIEKSQNGLVKRHHLPRNRGPAVARNRGWEIASGDYLAFLDADDSWHPRKIEIQYTWMERRPAVSVCGHGSIPCRPGQRDACLPATWRIHRVKPLSLLLSNRLLMRTVMVKRTLPYRFNEEKSRSEDYLLWLEAVLNGRKAVYLDLNLACSHPRPPGETGLSDSRWLMRKGELDTYRRIWKLRLIPHYLFLTLVPFSLFKHYLHLWRRS